MRLCNSLVWGDSPADGVIVSATENPRPERQGLKERRTVRIRGRDTASAIAISC